MLANVHCRVSASWLYCQCSCTPHQMCVQCYDTWLIHRGDRSTRCVLQSLLCTAWNALVLPNWLKKCLYLVIVPTHVYYYCQSTTVKRGTPSLACKPFVLKVGYVLLHFLTAISLRLYFWKDLMTSPLSMIDSDIIIHVPLSILLREWWVLKELTSEGLCVWGLRWNWPWDCEAGWSLVASASVCTPTPLH